MSVRAEALISIVTGTCLASMKLPCLYTAKFGREMRQGRSPGEKRIMAHGWVRRQRWGKKRGRPGVAKWLAGEELVRAEWRGTAREMEAGGKDHLCGDRSPGPTAQCWLSFNPPLLPPQPRRDSRRETGKPAQRPLGVITRRECAENRPEKNTKTPQNTQSVFVLFGTKRRGRSSLCGSESNQPLWQSTDELGRP